MGRQKKQHLKRRPDGRFACRYKDQWFYSNESDEDALAQREAYIQEERRGLRSAPYFKTYATTWLNAYKAHLTDGPYNTHVRNLNKFVSLLGDRPIDSYTQSDISSFYQQFNAMSKSTINSARDTIKGIFKAALADGVIPKDPAAFVVPPKGTKGTHRAITDEERMLIHNTEHRMRPVAMVMLYAGLRRGEALALNIDRDVDFAAETITVREAVRFRNGCTPEIVDPKTEAGLRTVPLSEELAKELKDHHGLLCTSSTGSIMTQSAWERAWESYLYALGVKKNGCRKRWCEKGKPWIPVSIRSHDLRHSYCSMLYDAGIDLKTAMRWMGHADQDMTMQIYTHLSEKRRTAAEKALRKAEKNAFGSQFGSHLKIAKKKVAINND